MITIDDFSKIDLRVGLIKAAEPIVGTRKLLKLSVDFGSEIRQIISGIADQYSPQELIGRKFVFVYNLQPKTIHGLISQGMILAAEDEKGKVYLVTVERDPPPGTKVH
ncbi:MAG: methionine--tRNA ligase subunit beta [Thermoprotei archaeon]